MLQTDPSSPPQFLTAQEVAQLLRITPRVLHSLVRAGRFPPGVRVSPYKRIWPRTTIEQFVANGGGPPPRPRRK
ncbi:MAG: helix-turn-helix domain-containing protein [Gemmataceae bacterium]|nr:helix-turn-helix domain-containing protein [Gemmataceae bacterium]MDW8244155.1 helix-turn-helix domain-containing protein [Thermogemmata sp.]